MPHPRTMRCSLEDMSKEVLGLVHVWWFGETLSLTRVKPLIECLRGIGKFFWCSVYSSRTLISQARSHRYLGGIP